MISARVHLDGALVQSSTEHGAELAAGDRDSSSRRVEWPVPIDVGRFHTDLARSVDAEEFVRRAAGFRRKRATPSITGWHNPGIRVR